MALSYQDVRIPGKRIHSADDNRDVWRWPFRGFLYHGSHECYQIHYGQRATIAAASGMSPRSIKHHDFSPFHPHEFAGSTLHLVANLSCCTFHIALWWWHLNSLHLRSKLRTSARGINVETSVSGNLPVNLQQLKEAKQVFILEFMKQCLLLILIVHY